MTTVRISGLVAVMVGATSVALANPAAADPPNGSYTYTNLTYPNIPHWEVLLTPCGTDCTHWKYVQNGGEWDFHLQGNRWVKVGDPTFSFDKDSLDGTQKDLPGPNPSPDFTGTQRFVLTKNG
jgi:hypothetical protein